MWESEWLDKAYLTSHSSLLANVPSGYQSWRMLWGCYGRGGPSFVLGSISICPPDFISSDTDWDAVNEVSLEPQCSHSHLGDDKNRIYICKKTDRPFTVRMPRLISASLASECRPCCMLCSSTSFSLLQTSSKTSMRSGSHMKMNPQPWFMSVGTSVSEDCQ